MKSFSQRLSNIEDGQAAMVQSTTPVEKSTNEKVAEQSSQDATIQVALPPPREEQSTSTVEKDPLDSGWADRDVEELPDYDEHVFWEPEGDSDDQESGTLKLSSSTTKIVEDAFGHSISNERRRSLKRKQPIPDTPFTKCPKLDPTIQSRLPKPAKDTDRNLARLQTLVLDAAASLLSTLESARNGSLTPKSAAESAQLALKLLGNASANISTERRRKATTYLNPELATLIDDEDTFREAAPLLFGKTFDQQARDHMEAVKDMFHQFYKLLQHLELRHTRNHYLQQSYQPLPFFSNLLLFSYETLTFFMFKYMRVERFYSSREWKILLAQ